MKTEKEFMPLMGRPWLDIIFPGWREYFRLNSVKRYKTVFDGDYTSTIKGQEASIVIERDTSPVFFGAYTVPYGQRQKVEKEIDRLVTNEILEPVRYSKWASPVVVVEKKDGNVRLCMDCRVSINKYVKTDVYPIPLMEDIFTEFVGCMYLFLQVGFVGSLYTIEGI